MMSATRETTAQPQQQPPPLQQQSPQPQPQTPPPPPQSQIRLSGHTLDKATKAKVHLENYFSNLIAQHIERKNR